MFTKISLYQYLNITHESRVSWLEYKHKEAATISWRKRDADKEHLFKDKHVGCTSLWVCVEQVMRVRVWQASRQAGVGLGNGSSSSAFVCLIHSFMS
jgi:hypothetical protein